MTIMAHGKAQETFDRHFHRWEALGHKLLIFCPENDLVKTGHPVLAWGEACHHGAHAIERFRNLLLHLERTPFDRFIIQEYDSFSLAEPTFREHTLYGNAFGTEDHRWLSKVFLHPPLAFDRFTLERLVAASGMIPDHAERGFWDRWLGLVCGLSGIRFQGWGIEGFSQNTIEPDQIKDAVAARQAGAIHFHGCKTAVCFEAILSSGN